MTAIVASKHFCVVFLQQRAISGIIYLTDIKPVHCSCHEILLNQIFLQLLVCQKCCFFQVT